ncbi:M23 family metallopeptidase [uncultured Schumannella sp.]|uniref:M23 family metallopeptidase n=1 Tax=uncultured Schumannella sp. TaxID=1195956 RepID=UPI0025ED689D|nr:M23 family metallopeptidase [uncultured Schumannella sp.]
MDKLTRRAATRLRLGAGGVTVAFLLAVSALVPSPVSALVGQEYPSWEQVVAARQNEAAAKTLKQQLEQSLSALQAEAQTTQSEADAKGEVYAETQQRFDDQQVVTQALLDQTAAAQEESDAAYAVAAQVIAEMSKNGSSDVTSRLWFAPGNADSLLDRLEISRVIGDRYADIYQKALELRNRAQALADQAEVAQTLLDELKVAAEQAFQVAQAAAEEAAAKLEQTEKDIAEMRARIEYLEGVREQTVADYNEGLAAQWGDGAAGEISQSGWARPVGGYISSMFGMRVNPATGVYQLHTGVDLAGMGCGATIRAAHAGTVTYAGWSGSWGYYVAIDHGDGTGSGYSHIQAGGIGVRIGQEVSPGQPIAKVGTTGASTGCHLHFIVRVGGKVVDPVPFMRNQGITLG